MFTIFILISHEDVIEARHFDDDVFVYGLHDMAPRFQIANGGTYGIPHHALCVKDINNLYPAGMLIISDRRLRIASKSAIGATQTLPAISCFSHTSLNRPATSTPCTLLPCRATTNNN